MQNKLIKYHVLCVACYAQRFGPRGIGHAGGLFLGLMSDALDAEWQRYSTLIQICCSEFTWHAFFLLVFRFFLCLYVCDVVFIFVFYLRIEIRLEDIQVQGRLTDCKVTYFDAD